MATNKPRIPVTLEPELLEQVTAYRLEHGITSQSKAIRQLVRLGLDSRGPSVPVREAPPETAERQEASAETRESESPERQERESEPRDSQERELLAIARELDPAQKALLFRILELAGESAGTRRNQ